MAGIARVGVAVGASRAAGALPGLPEARHEQQRQHRDDHEQDGARARAQQAVPTAAPAAPAAPTEYAGRMLVSIDVITQPRQARDPNPTSSKTDNDMINARGTGKRCLISGS